MRATWLITVLNFQNVLIAAWFISATTLPIGSAYSDQPIKYCFLYHVTLDPSSTIVNYGAVLIVPDRRTT